MTDLSKLKPYRFSPEELASVLAIMEAQTPITLRELCAAAGISEFRARWLLNALCVEAPRDWKGGNRTGDFKRWDLRHDYRDVAAQHLASAEAARMRTYVKPKRLRDPEGDTWPWGHAYHFQTNGMGRVTSYVGPRKAGDEKWDMGDDE